MPDRDRAVIADAVIEPQVDFEYSWNYELFRAQRKRPGSNHFEFALPVVDPGPDIQEFDPIVASWPDGSQKAFPGVAVQAVRLHLSGASSSRAKHDILYERKHNLTLHVIHLKQKEDHVLRIGIFEQCRMKTSIAVGKFGPCTSTTMSATHPTIVKAVDFLKPMVDDLCTGAVSFENIQDRIKLDYTAWQANQDVPHVCKKRLAADLPRLSNKPAAASSASHDDCPVAPHVVRDFQQFLILNPLWKCPLLAQCRDVAELQMSDRRYTYLITRFGCTQLCTVILIATSCTCISMITRNRTFTDPDSRHLFGDEKYKNIILPTCALARVFFRFPAFPLVCIAPCNPIMIVFDFLHLPLCVHGRPFKLVFFFRTCMVSLLGLQPILGLGSIFISPCSC